MVESQDLESISFNSSIVENLGSDYWEKLCVRPVQERLRLWLDSYFAILWSCDEKENEGEHDEAVIMLAFLPEQSEYYIEFQYNPEEHRKMLLRLKTVAEKYLSQSLIETIDWSQGPIKHSNTTETFTMYPC